ncbi:MAG: beta-ketoacyl-ACP synthase II [Oscillospiraceae bacterium]|nr:beta-ketoacyl-ACP synthase II [Oscillospiraceae bacterium]
MRRVVVTGLGAVTPIGNDLASTWEAMCAGRHGITPITKFDTEGFKATLAAEVKNFDPSLYMERAELRRNELCTIFGIAAADQAVKDSGIMGHIEPERFGTYFSTGVGGVNVAVTESEKIAKKGPGRVSPYGITMLMPNDAAGEVSIRFNAQGPSFGIVSACASSNHALGEAYRAIAHGYADAIIAGGSEAAIIPITVASFTNCMALTKTNDPDRASIPFDAQRSGFVMGEGAAALILEEYEHAKARGARIYAEFCGYGATSDAHHITAPDPEAKGGSRAIRMAYEQAGVDTDKIYINAHGTSTPMNDKIETLAIKKALGEDLARKVMISSTKSMTGHMLGAAGAVEAVASVMALYTGVVPPTVGLQEADPNCDLDYVPNVKREAEIELALSSSLGFGGHNACIAFKKVRD